jgi:acetylornithine deacetylase
MSLESARSILADLIAIPTVSADSNLQLIAYAQQLLDTLDAKAHMTLDETGAKANLFATIGPDVDGGVVLSGHTDVVPVEGQDWSSNPFAADERDGRIYGRGACDMKGFIACALALAPRFAAAELARPLHLALTYDEEVGCLGAQVMLKALAESGRRPSVCVIGEPTEMRIIQGHKGCYEYTTTFGGLEGHGSYPDRGVNAVEYAARFIGKLLDVGEALKDRAPRGSCFDPPWSTIQTGVIHGGIARNVIPRECLVDWEMRPVNRADAEFALAEIRACTEHDLLPRMRAHFPEASIVTHVIGEVEGLEPMPSSEALDLVQELTGGNSRDVVSFGTEAGLFQKHGIATVVCGPGSIMQAHKPDEFVALDQLEQCLAMIERLVAKLERPA